MESCTSARSGLDPRSSILDPTSSPPFRVAVIGTGHLGRIHAKLLSQRDDVALVGVVDPNEPARTAVAAAHAVQALADHQPLLGRIDAAVVATPTRFHHAVALDLLRHGVHVLVEKPITTTLAEADELIAAADCRGLTLQVGHVERFNPAWRQVQPHLVRPRYIEATRCGPYTFRSIDVSVVYDLMIHDVDLVLSVVAAPVRRVDAVGGCVLGRHADWAHARVEFENGCVATFHASRVSVQPQRRWHVYSDAGMATIDFGSRAATLVGLAPLVCSGEFDAEQVPLADRAALKDRVFNDLLPRTDLSPADGNAIADEHANFLDSIRSRRPPQVDGRQGRAALAVCEAIGGAIAAGDVCRPAVLSAPFVHDATGQPRAA